MSKTGFFDASYIFGAIEAVANEVGNGCRVSISHVAGSDMWALQVDWPNNYHYRQEFTIDEVMRSSNIIFARFAGDAARDYKRYHEQRETQSGDGK